MVILGSYTSFAFPQRPLVTFPSSVHSSFKSRNTCFALTRSNMGHSLPENAFNIWAAFGFFPEYLFTLLHSSHYILISISTKLGEG